MATTALTKTKTPKVKPVLRKHSKATEETPPAALCDRDRLLAALASRPTLDKETGEQFRRDIEEAREASIAGPFD